MLCTLSRRARPVGVWEFWMILGDRADLSTRRMSQPKAFGVSIADQFVQVSGHAPLMAFIIMSILSFIICISYAICIASRRLCLLVTLLSSQSFLSRWSLVGRWLSSCLSLCWSLVWARRSFIIWDLDFAHHYTCLSKTLEGFLVSKLVVVIDHVWTMQLFVLESSDMANHLVPTEDTN